MHESCKSVSDGELYVIIVLVVSLVLRVEAGPKDPISRIATFGRVD